MSLLLALGGLLAACTAPAQQAGLTTAPLAVAALTPALPPQLAPAVAAAPAPALEYDPTHVVVSLKPGASVAEFLASDAARGLAVAHQFGLAGHPVVVVGVASGTAEAVKRQLAGAPGVTRASLDTRAYPHAAPAAEFYPQQWAHKPGFANTEGAWALLAKNHVDQSTVAIADIDTGVDSDHTAFAGRMLTGAQPTAYANVGPTLEPDPPGFTGDQFGHGTFTAGIAAARGDDAGNSAVAGVAWGVKILPIKVDHEEQDHPGDPTSRHWGRFNLSDVVAGIQWASDHNAPADGNGAMVRVINLSLGQNTLGIEPLYVEAVAYARSKGILCVASTGNAGAEQIPPPANTPGVVAVGATSHLLTTEFLSPDSNFGPRLDLVAPGGGIISTVPFNPGGATGSELGSRTAPYDFRGYAWASGTSEAAPFVTGVAALIFAQYDPGNASMKTGKAEDPGKMVDRVRAHLLRSVDDLGAPGWDPAFGAGRINVLKALSAPAPLPDGPAPSF